MALFGLFGKKKKDEEFAPPEMGLGRERELGMQFPRAEEETIGAGIAPKAMDVPPGEPVGEPAMPSGMPMGMRQPMMQPQMPAPTIEKDLELLSAKLDALKALLENINHRLESLERIAHGEPHERYY